MKFIYLANGDLGLNILEYLIKSGSPPCGMVLHYDSEPEMIERYKKLSGLEPEFIISAQALQTEKGLEWSHSISPVFLISAGFRSILKPRTLSVPKLGSINIHTSYLPFNRGAHPNVWSIIKKSPAGVTMHMIDDGVDTGNIIAQRRIEIDMYDTGETLYKKLQSAAVKLFKETWCSIVNNTFVLSEQCGIPTSHKVSDLTKYDAIDPEALYKAQDLIDLIRARSFSGYDGAYLDYGKKRVYLSLALEEREVEYKINQKVG